MNCFKMAVPLVFGTFLAFSAGCAAEEEPVKEPYYASTTSYEVYFELLPDPARVAPDNTMSLRVVTREGIAVIGAIVTAQPTVVIDSHGSPTVPLVQDMGDGTYEMTSLNFDVAGRWQLNLQIAEPGNTPEGINPEDPIFLEVSP